MPAQSVRRIVPLPYSARKDWSRCREDVGLSCSDRTERKQILRTLTRSGPDGSRVDFSCQLWSTIL